MPIEGTWTYGGDPSTSNRDLVRFYAGLTDSTNQRVSDEEIQAFITSEGSALKASVQILRALASAAVVKVSKTVGDLEVDFQALAAAYSARAKDLETSASAATTAAAPRSTASDKGKKRSAELDLSRIPAYFKRGMMDDAATAPDTDLDSEVL